MKNSLKLFTISLVIMSLACGGGSNPIEAKKASLEKLKKQALALNGQIASLEKELNKKAIKNLMPMQKGDVQSTLSDTNLLKRITNYNPSTSYKLGVKRFIKWYKDYYKQ